MQEGAGVVRRMYGVVHPVIALHRIEFAGVTLPKHLSPGEWEYLAPSALLMI